MIRTANIRIAALTRTFATPHPVHALREVSLLVEAGSWVLLEGPSGSGKTTLLGILGALDRATSGTIEVGGVEITGRSAGWLADYRRRHVGFVFQDFRLLDSLTAIENVALALQLGGAGRREALTRSAAVLEEMGLGDRARHRPSRLSAGERQRVAVARAAADRRSLLLADEPTANLDGDNSRFIATLLRSLCREHGITVIVASHDRRLEPYADRVIGLEDGALTGKEKRS